MARRLAHTNPRRGVLAIGLVGLGLLARAAPAQACSCLPMSPDEAYANADGVFSGTVQAVNAPAAGGGGMEPVTVELAVQTLWKGPVPATLTLQTPADSAACGYPFETGTGYLVYAYHEGAIWTTNLCTRTAVLTQAGEDLVALGPGTPVAPAATPPTGGRPGVVMDPGVLATYGLALAVVVGLAVAVVLLARRAGPGAAA
jgi:hypothetical protein